MAAAGRAARKQRVPPATVEECDARLAEAVAVLHAAITRKAKTLARTEIDALLDARCRLDA